MCTPPGFGTGPCGCSPQGEAKNGNPLCPDEIPEGGTQAEVTPSGDGESIGKPVVSGTGDCKWVKTGVAPGLGSKLDGMGKNERGAEVAVTVGPLMTGAGVTGRPRACPLGEDNPPVVPAEAGSPWRSQLGVDDMVPPGPKEPGKTGYPNLGVLCVESGGAPLGQANPEVPLSVR